MSLCERFPNLNPIKVRKYAAHEVFLLIKRLAKYNSKQEPKGKNAKKNNAVIRRKAGDNWF